VSTPSGPAIRCTDLRKSYDDVVAVDGLDLLVERGTCLALLGPNGAGKTTTIEILEGLGTADSGEVRVLGLDWRTDAREIRTRIGAQLQETQFQDKVTVFEVLRLFRSFYEKGRAPEEVIELVELGEKAKTQTVKLSGGQRQRLALGCALVNRPDLLFLDEPTTGLDPQARRHVWEVVETIKREGGTVLLTTHYMEEAERLADEVVIIDHGRSIAEGSPRELVRSLDAESIVEYSLAENGHEGPAVEVLEALPGVHTVRRVNELVSLAVASTSQALPALLELLARQGCILDDLNTHRPTLEDVFVAHTGRHLRDE